MNLTALAIRLPEPEGRASALALLMAVILLAIGPLTRNFVWPHFGA
ncbi:MAG: hypothetical protein ACRERE_24140 [Candidatus Entotheonellia bacterium]